MLPGRTTNGSGRETRLLLVTIAVSVGALLLLARFRFPEQAVQPAQPAPAPLERLAARAAFDELASAMADLERRIAPRLTVVRLSPGRATGSYAVAPRVTPDRAVVILGPDEAVEEVNAQPPQLVSHEVERGLAVLGVERAADAVVTPRSGTPRQGPRYVVAVEGSAQGPTLRPVYVGKTSLMEDADTGAPVLLLEALQSQVPRGAAVFSLDGVFLGLVSRAGPTTALIGGDTLVEAAGAAVASASPARGDLGIEVQDTTPALLQAAGAERGVMVTFVRSGGPAGDALHPGDVVQAIDGIETPTVAAFRGTERSRAPGSPVTLNVVRRGAARPVTYNAGDSTVAAPTDESGISVRAIAGIGLDVVAVQPESVSARSGLRRGDLILTVNGEPARETAAMTRAYRSLKSGESVLVGIERAQQHRVVALVKP